LHADLADWVATKLRWNLAADPAERQTLTRLVEGCDNTVLEVVPAP
jgi:hypothetical protein